jgi:hypothetical protein
MVLLTTSAIGSELDPAGMTQVMNGVDDSAYHVQLAHNFPHLDKVFTDAWMSTNGFILLWSPTNNLGVQNSPFYGHCCDGYNFSAGTPNYLDNVVGQFSYMLAPLWTDLDDTNALKDDGYYYYTDTDRSRFLWYKVTEYGRPDALNTFQINIDKSGGFEYIYDDVAIDSHQVFIGWTGDTANDPYWHTQQFYGDKFTMDPNATGQLISSYGGDLATNEYSNGNFGLVGRADCTNPLNNSTCDGYWDAVAESSVTNQYTDNVFGDEVEDYFFTDNQDRQGQNPPPPPPPYQDTQQEREMFGLAPSANEPPTGEPSRPDQQRQQERQQQRQQEPEMNGELEQIDRSQPVERVEPPIEIIEEPIDAVREPTPERRPNLAVMREEPALQPVEVERVEREERVEILREPEAERETEKVVEREVIRPAVDVVGIALSTVGQPTYRSSSTSSQRSQMTFQEQQEFSPTTDVYDVQIQTTQAVAQQAQQQETNTITTSDALAPASQMQFESDFNDAIATGQSVGQFLSAQLPDFSRFDVAPPSQDEQRTVQRAETQIQTMSQQAVQQNTEAQLEEVQDAGGFVDQSLTVLLISNNPEFNQYSQAQLADKQFYQNKVIYAGNRTIDRPLILRSGSNTYNAMVDEQWQR